MCRSLLGVVALLLLATNGHAQNPIVGSGACSLTSGTGSPEASIYGKLCDQYIRTDGVADTTIYIKLTGSAGSPSNTGWAPTAMVRPLYDIGNSSTAFTANWNNGHRQKVTMTGDAVVTFSNPIDGYTYALVIINPSDNTITWPASVVWPAATPPTLGTGADEVDICAFQYVASTAKYYGACSTAY